MNTEITGAIPPIPAPRPFPFFPPQPTEREMTRMELMMQLNMWDNNNPAIAKKHAQTMIELLEEQFDINQMQSI